jgi:hypothetical protein
MVSMKGKSKEYADMVGNKGKYNKDLKSYYPSDGIFYPVDDDKKRNRRKTCESR